MSDQKMVGEQELLDLFAKRRADADRFAAGIAQRLAGPDEAEDKGQNEDEDQNAAPKLLPRAAAWMPFPLSGSKLWLWLSMPVLLIAGSWLAMFGAAGSIRRSLRLGTADPGEPETSAKQTRKPRRAPKEFAQLLVSAALVAVPLLGWPDLFDAVLVACVASMAALAILVRRAAREGKADRVQVAALCSGLLETLLIFALVCAIPQLGAFHPGRWIMACVVTAAVGILMLVRYAPGNVLNLVMFSFVIVLMANFKLLRFRTPKLATMAQVQEFVDTAKLKRSDARLSDYCETLLALRAAGVAATPPEGFHERVAKPIFPGGPIGAATLTQCAHAELLPDALWRQMAERPYHSGMLEELLTGKGPITIPDYDEYILRIATAQPLTAAQRANLTDRLVASWPGPHHQAPLLRSRMVAWGLDLLGAKELADAETDRVHAHIVRMQNRSGFRRGGFSERAGTELQFVLPADEVAMWLIARFGLPTDLNSHALRLYLQKATELSRLGKRPSANDDAFVAFAQLQQLDSLGPLPDRGIQQVLLEERLLWTMIAMVLLCLYAVSIAPHRLKDESGQTAPAPQGAMP